MKENSKIKGKVTEFGFEWGPIEVSRACSDDKKGWVVLLLKTEKHPDGLQVYVTKKGKIRVHSGSKEWKPEKQAEESNRGMANRLSRRK